MLDFPIGREPIQLVRIYQPFCANSFGVAPCTATGTADSRCYNTRATCRSAADFALGEPLSLWFTTMPFLPTLAANQALPMETPSDWILAGGVWDDSGVWYDSAFWQDDADTKAQLSYEPVHPSYPKYVFPALQSVSTTSTRPNMSGASRDASGLGTRGLLRFTVADFQHTDRLVDPYIDGRSWDALSPDRGSFWPRWMVRNKYRANVQVDLYEGYMGQPLGDMKRRTFFVAGVSRQSSDGSVTFECKDILARLEERQAQVPAASPGVLYTDITSSATSFEVAGAVVSEYPASGTLRINSELMTYTARATSGNGVQFTGVTRGTDGTVADAHSADDGVQECIRYTQERISDVLVDLIQTRGGVPAEYMTDFLDGGDGFNELRDYLGLARITRILTEPESVSKLVADMAEQYQFYIWWEETEQRVRVKCVHGYEDPPDTLTEESHIISGTFQKMDKPRERASQVWVSFAPVDYTQSLTNFNNYRTRYIAPDLESETPDQYGSPSIRKIAANWVTQSAMAAVLAKRISVKYRDVPEECTFQVDIKDGGYTIGDVVFLSHHLDLDDFGQRRLRPWVIIEREEVVPNERVRYVVSNLENYGRVYRVGPDGAGDYDPNNVPFGAAYIGDGNGLLSDGTEAARIG